MDHESGKGRHKLAIKVIIEIDREGRKERQRKKEECARQRTARDQKMRCKELQVTNTENPLKSCSSCSDVPSQSR